MNLPSKQCHREALINLIKQSISNYHYLGGDTPFADYSSVTHYKPRQGEWKIEPLARPLTLLNKAQLDLIEWAVLQLEADQIPGDYIEAGVWRGGVIILLRALIEAYGIPKRKVIAADSFSGIPKNVHFKHDPVDDWSDRWIASLDEVRGNIARYGYLDERVEFAVGYFADSLGPLAGERFALIRLDSDSHDSIKTSLDYLYPQLSKGGVIIIDDWHLPGSWFAVGNYRKDHGITDEIKTQGGNAYWVKQQDYGSPPRP